MDTCADVAVLGSSDDARCVRVHGVPVEFEGVTGKLWCQQCSVDTPFGLQEGVICPGATALMPVSLLARAGGSFRVTCAGG